MATSNVISLDMELTGHFQDSCMPHIQDFIFHENIDTVVEEAD